MSYRFKPVDELLWGVIIAAALVLLQVLVTFDPETVTDWQAWAVALGGGMVRAAAGAAIDYIRRSVQVTAASPAVDTLVEKIAALSPSERSTLIDQLERRSGKAGA